MGEFWHHYTELMADPAHMAVEFTFVLIDVLIIQAFVAWVKRHFHRDLREQHKALDAEHGVAHPHPPEDGIAPRYPLHTGGYPAGSKTVDQMRPPPGAITHVRVLKPDTPPAGPSGVSPDPVTGAR